MQPRREQRLVGVDVADAGDRVLVEQRGLDGRDLAAAELRVEARRSEPGSYGVGAERAQRRRSAVRPAVDEHLAERARVDEAQLRRRCRGRSRRACASRFVGPDRRCAAGRSCAGARPARRRRRDRRSGTCRGDARRQRPTAQRGDEVGVRLAPHGAVTRDRDVTNRRPVEKRVRGRAERSRPRVIQARTRQLLPTRHGRRPARPASSNARRPRPAGRGR